MKAGRALILAMAGLAGVSARAYEPDRQDFVNDTDEYVTVARPASVIDTAVVAKTIEARVARVDSELAVLAKRIAALETERGKAQGFLNNPNKKVKEEAEKALLDSIVGDTFFVLASQDEPEPGKRRVENVMEYTYSADGFKLKDVRKDAGKGKLNDAVRACLTALVNSLNADIEQLRGEERILNKDRERFSASDLERAYYAVTGSGCPRKMVTRNVRERNMWLRTADNQYLRQHIDRMLQTRGWEWAENGSMVQKTEYYPVEVTYMQDPEHPEHRIIGYNVYDSNGGLTRVLSLADYDLYVITDLTDKLMEALVVNDYEQDRYGIKSAPQNVQYAVVNKLGISDDYNKRVKKAQAELDRLNRLYSKAKTTTERKRISNMKEVVYKQQNDDRQLIDSDDAVNFIRQCRSDHEGDLETVWKVERVNGTTFDVQYLNSEHTQLTHCTVRFVNSAPYGTPQPVYSFDKVEEFKRNY